MPLPNGTPHETSSKVLLEGGRRASCQGRKELPRMAISRQRTGRTSTGSLTRFAVLVGALVVLWPQREFNQQVSGTITGYVTDQSCPAVPGAAVTAINGLTGVATKNCTEQ